MSKYILVCLEGKCNYLHALKQHFEGSHTQLRQISSLTDALRVIDEIDGDVPLIVTNYGALIALWNPQDSSVSDIHKQLKKLKVQTGAGQRKIIGIADLGEPIPSQMKSFGCDTVCSSTDLMKRLAQLGVGKPAGGDSNTEVA